MFRSNIVFLGTAYLITWVAIVAYASWLFRAGAAARRAAELAERDATSGGAR